MTETIKSFGKLPASEISGGGVKSQITWESLLPYLKQAFHIRPNESLEGIQITSQGILAHIKSKTVNESAQNRRTEMDGEIG